MRVKVGDTWYRIRTLQLPDAVVGRDEAGNPSLTLDVEAGPSGGYSPPVRSAEGAPDGAPAADALPLAVDTATGSVFVWNGTAWLALLTSG